MLFLQVDHKCKLKTKGGFIQTPVVYLQKYFAMEKFDHLNQLFVSGQVSSFLIILEDYHITIIF